MCGSMSLCNAVRSDEKISLHFNSRLSSRQPGALSSLVKVAIVLSARDAVVVAALDVVVVQDTGSSLTS